MRNIFFTFSCKSKVNICFSMLWLFSWAYKSLDSPAKCFCSLIIRLGDSWPSHLYIFQRDLKQKGNNYLEAKVSWAWEVIKHFFARWQPEIYELLRISLHFFACFPCWEWNVTLSSSVVLKTKLAQFKKLLRTVIIVWWRVNFKLVSHEFSTWTDLNSALFLKSVLSSFFVCSHDDKLFEKLSIIEYFRHATLLPPRGGCQTRVRK